MQTMSQVMLPQPSRNGSLMMGICSQLGTKVNKWSMTGSRKENEDNSIAGSVFLEILCMKKMEM
uniref:Uncharacterized protein n=1 Tax=Arundo donax TaxID=35708 RepID=A0A0A9C8H9_ARUDO